MSEFEDLDETETESHQERNPLRSRMRELESEIKSLRQQAAEAEQAKRELAFVKAGVDPSDTAAKYFVKGYDGELTVDAIKAAAVEARLLAPTQPPSDWSCSRRPARKDQMMVGWVQIGRAHV